MPSDYDDQLFIDMLVELENGRFVADATRKMRELVKAVMENRKVGTVTIKIKVSPTGREAVELDISSTFKVPEPSPSSLSTTFFPSPDGDLLRDDPAQPRLNLQRVDDE